MTELEKIQEKQWRAEAWIYCEALVLTMRRMAEDSSLPSSVKQLLTTKRQGMAATSDLEDALNKAMPNKKVAEFWEKVLIDTINMLDRTTPYGGGFELDYPEEICDRHLVYATAFIADEVATWQRECAGIFFRVSGLRYVADVLIHARYHNKKYDHPSIQRTIEWLEEQIRERSGQSDPDELMILGRILPVEASGVELMHISKEQVAEVLAKCGMSSASKPGKWAAISSALRRVGFMEGTHTAVQKWLTTEFGAPASIRRTLSDKGESNSVFMNKVENALLAKATQLFKEYKKPH